MSDTMKATLVGHTTNPISQTLAVWDASKSEEPLDEILQRYRNLNLDYDFRARNSLDGERAEAMSLFQRILDERIPVGEFITFNFILEGVPVSWREQAVRHRVGVKYGPNYGVDVIPEEGASFWSQSMRIQNMGVFADKGAYHLPETIKTGSPEADVFITAMEGIQSAYNELVASGVPMEDARQLIPLGATHRIAMSINLAALSHIIGERSCWILQGGLWAPVIASMVNELATKVHPVFRNLVTPPCIASDGSYDTCAYVEENIRRMDGRDQLPVCPMYFQERERLAIATGDLIPVIEAAHAEAVKERIPQYAALWDQPQLAETWTWTPRA